MLTISSPFARSPSNNIVVAFGRGEQLRLIRDLHIEDAEGVVTRIIPAGTIWEVLTGAIEDPNALWLEQPDGELHSWDDDESVFEIFERFTA